MVDTMTDWESNSERKINPIKAVGIPKLFVSKVLFIVYRKNNWLETRILFYWKSLEI